MYTFGEVFSRSHFDRIKFDSIHEKGNIGGTTRVHYLINTKHPIEKDLSYTTLTSTTYLVLNLKSVAIPYSRMS